MCHNRVVKLKLDIGLTVTSSLSGFRWNSQSLSSGCAGGLGGDEEFFGRAALDSPQDLGMMARRISNFPHSVSWALSVLLARLEMVASEVGQYCREAAEVTQVQLSCVWTTKKGISGAGTTFRVARTGS